MLDGWINPKLETRNSKPETLNSTRSIAFALCRPALLLAAMTITLAQYSGCGLFDTRTPEPPSESNCFSVPQTRPGIVIMNLQTAVSQKCADTYGACFSGGTAGQQPLVFIPSAEARDQYAAVLNNWTIADEQAFFRNLVARGVVNGFASLLLVARDSVISPDSVVYSYDYSFTFQHTEPGFPATARGNMQLSLAPDGSNVWRIYRWVDLKTTDDVTWSVFKGRFSN